MLYTQGAQSLEIRDDRVRGQPQAGVGVPVVAGFRGCPSSAM